ncbi:MAG: vibriolysin, partial [Acidobacteriota bacterium]|nr:vibriolysin [Acidobacteriota bacterium]
ENHSNLTYSGQSGGMNESFSDMAGEAAKYYMRGSNDFMCGYDIYKAAGKALRYLCNPPLDGISIDHVSEYYTGLDVHYSSGIYNKVFCLVAQSSGWTTRMAFDIFTKANVDYWTASETFVSGAEDVRQATLDYGYNCADVAAAFANVGITITACPSSAPPVANFSGNPTTVLVGSNVAFTDLSTNAPTSWAWTFPGGTPSSSTVKNPTVTYSTIGTYNVSLTATNAYGSDGETKTAYINVVNSIPDDIAEALDVTGMTFTKSGNANWYKVTDVSYNGGDSARSGAIGHSQSCSIETTVTVTEAKNVKFWWQVSSESGYDYLRFYIDGVQKNQISGSTTWAQVSNAMATGTHTLKWTYSKDASVVSGSDCGWVDKLEIVTGGVVYCTAASTNCTDEWIARVRIGTLDKSSTATNYSDFTSTITNYTRGASQSVTLNPGYRGTVYTEYWRIFIDYNKDGDFADTGETVFSKTGTTSVTGSFTISSSASTGNTRMRVTMRYGAYAASCGTFTYGEVEDYTANIL